MSKYLSAIILLVIIVCSGCLQPDSSKNDTQIKPNILFIAIDDLRPELGVYGNEQIKTPHIDQLGKVHNPVKLTPPFRFVLTPPFRRFDPLQ